MSELLSIAIPTRNRATYLRELLFSIEEPVKANRDLLNDIKIYVFDNASNDHTYDVVRNSNLNIAYQRNNENIGVDANIYQAYSAMEGKYVWVIGDDEILAQNTLDLVLEMLKNYNPHLIICKTCNYDGLAEPWIFPTYYDFARHVKQADPWLLIGHSLISCNILLKSCFDGELALQKRDTHYGHFYGMVKGLQTLPGPVLMPHKYLLIIREQRAPWVDGIGPENLRGDWDTYIEWVIKEYGLDS
jgi:glycosyltransferase involved in cell wall biosynthesis